MSKKHSLTWILFAALAVIIVTQATFSAASSSATCKELNHVACYAGQNEGYFCSKKDQISTVTRWFFDRGNCRKFDYKGCYGNRNRFCTKQECERRCGGNGK